MRLLEVPGNSKLTDKMTIFLHPNRGWAFIRLWAFNRSFMVLLHAVDFETLYYRTPETFLKHYAYVLIIFLFHCHVCIGRQSKLPYSYSAA